MNMFYALSAIVKVIFLCYLLITISRKQALTISLIQEERKKRNVVEKRKKLDKEKIWKNKPNRYNKSAHM
jgi:hypothetical protein